MPKMKSRKAVKARFKLTGTGKLKRRRPGLRHILTKKTSKRKRSIKKTALVDESQKKTFLRMLAK